MTEPSRKQAGLRGRRVRLTAGEGVFTVAPAWVMPSLTASVAAVEKAMWLMRFHVPGRALAQVFGRDALFWYRLAQRPGRFRGVGTTVKAPERLPQDRVADEKHGRLDGEKIHIATTAGEGCMLGASAADSASATALRPADGVFAEGARAVAADDTPATANTDGWAATQGAWKRWFPGITIILCFLHAFLKIRDRATPALAEGFAPASQQVWGAYRAPGKAAFAQRLRRRREWAERTLPDSPMKHPALDRCAQRAPFSRSDDPARAHRTSHLVDRWMKFLDRACFNAQYFHGTLASAESRARAGLVVALLPLVAAYREEISRPAMSRRTAQRQTVRGTTGWRTGSSQAL